MTKAPCTVNRLWVTVGLVLARAHILPQRRRRCKSFMLIYLLCCFFEYYMYVVVGRSIGLHNFTGPLFDCGDIQRVYISSSVVSVRLDADTQLRY